MLGSNEYQRLQRQEYLPNEKWRRIVWPRKRLKKPYSKRIGRRILTGLRVSDLVKSARKMYGFVSTITVEKYEKHLNSSKMSHFAVLGNLTSDIELIDLRNFQQLHQVPELVNPLKKPKMRKWHMRRSELPFGTGWCTKSALSLQVWAKFPGKRSWTDPNLYDAPTFGSGARNGWTAIHLLDFLNWLCWPGKSDHRKTQPWNSRTAEDSCKNWQLMEFVFASSQDS